MNEAVLKKLCELGDGFVVAEACRPAAPFDIDSSTTADCDPADLEAGDAYNYTWSPVVPDGATVCYPDYVADNGDGSFTLNGVIDADGNIQFPAGGGPDGQHPITGVVFHLGQCFELPTDICSGGDNPVTIDDAVEFFTAKVTFDDGVCVIVDPETGEPVEDARLCEPGEGPVTAEDAKAKLEQIEPKVCTAAQCVKWQSVVVQLDNTGTLFSEATEITVTSTDGSVDTFTTGPHAGWSDQVADIAAQMDGIYNGLYDPRCTFLPNGCGGLLPPPSDAPAQPDIFARYINGVHCPTDIKIPVSATAVRASGKEVNLPLYVIETPEKRGWVCPDCCEPGQPATLLDENFEPVPEADLPVCTFSCAETIPDAPLSVCQFDTIPGDWCDIVVDGDPAVEDTIVQSEIVVQVATCGAEQSVGFFIIEDEALTPYEPVGSVVDCETGEEPFVEPPPCPEGAVFECVEIPGSGYGILDNSNWVGAPAVHLQGGNAYEITLTKEDGTAIVLPVLTDPYFNSFIATANTELPNCVVKSVCANHTSPAGCSPAMVANLAAYPAYDPPTYPGDVQNNLSNPDQAELWASGWLIDCAGCESPIVRAEITGSSDPAWVGASRDINVYRNDPVKLFRSINCDGVFWKDCDGNDVPAPAGGCCATPCAAPSEVLDDILDALSCPAGAATGEGARCTDPIPADALNVSTKVGINEDPSTVTFAVLAPWTLAQLAAELNAAATTGTGWTVVGDQLCTDDTDVASLWLASIGEGGAVFPLNDSGTETGEASTLCQKLCDLNDTAAAILDELASDQDITVEYVCSDDTDTWLEIISIDGVSGEPTDSGIPCSEEPPEPPANVTVREECRDGALNYVVYEIGEDALTELSASVTPFPCDAGESCDLPLFVKECPPDPCPPPSIEIYCDENDVKYVVVGHAAEVCGTSGTFLADGYFATPQTLTTHEPVGVPQICDDAVIKEQECVVDECGDRFTCVTVINTVGGSPVESQTCVPFIENEDCAEPEAEGEGRLAKAFEGKRQAVKSLGAVKSIKVSVVSVNTQIAETADPDTGQMVVPVGETCPCPCPDETAEATTSLVANGCYNGQPAAIFVKTSCPDGECSDAAAENLFTNGDLEGNIAISTVPTGWSQIPFSDATSQSSGAPRDTSDTTGLTGHNVTVGIAGTPHSGNTFVSSLFSNGGGLAGYDEGIQQTVTGLTVGTVYDVCFWQAVVQQSNATAQTGSWAVYLDNTAIATTAPTTTGQTSPTDVNLNWEQRCVTFTATATSHAIKFHADTTETASPVRMGIDTLTLFEQGAGSSCCVNLECVAVVPAGQNTPVAPAEGVAWSLAPCPAIPVIDTELELEATCALVDGVKTVVWQVIETVFVDGVETAQNQYLLGLDGEPVDGEVVACDPDISVLQADVCDPDLGTLIAVTIDGATSYYDPTNGQEVTPADVTAVTAGACALPAPPNTHIVNGCIAGANEGDPPQSAYWVVDNLNTVVSGPHTVAALPGAVDCCPIFEVPE